jgi:hypothetical protein
VRTKIAIFLATIATLVVASPASAGITNQFIRTPSGPTVAANTVVTITATWSPSIKPFLSYNCTNGNVAQARSYFDGVYQDGLNLTIQLPAGYTCTGGLFDRRKGNAYPDTFVVT